MNTFLRPCDKEAIRAYYNRPQIRARLIEFMDTCVFISNSLPLANEAPRPAPARDLEILLGDGADIYRSLWDRQHLIVHIDLEYVNFDFPAEPYLDPVRSFSLQQNVLDAFKNLLLQHGITPLPMMTGRGHHLVWSVRKESAAFRELRDIGKVPVHLMNYYDWHSSLEGVRVDRATACAFSGLGMVIEHLAGAVLAETANREGAPARLTDVAVGPRERGREIVSIDISEYGDPLTTRAVHIPFSVYLKPWKRPGVLHERIGGRIPVMFSIAAGGIHFSEGIAIMRDAERAADHARAADTTIPDMSRPMRSLVAEYRRSDLARFHEYFYSCEHHVPDAWPSTYDTIDLRDFPECIAHILRRPNDLLLTPTGMQHIVRACLAKGWHPRHIAGLIRSKFERDYGWGERWFVYDAATRADFYTRMFSGLVATHRDGLRDFDCLSTKEKRYCFQPEAGCDLSEVRQKAAERTYA